MIKLNGQSPCHFQFQFVSYTRLTSLESIFFTWYSRSSRMESYLLASKIVSMFILGLATWIIGLVPMVAVRRGWISKKESDGNPRLTKILSCMMCFGGGVIMTSSLAHMLPDVKEVLDNSIANGTFPPTSECRLPGLPFHMSSLCQQCRCLRYWCWEGSSSSTAWRSSLT